MLACLQMQFSLTFAAPACSPACNVGGILPAAQVACRSWRVRSWLRAAGLQRPHLRMTRLRLLQGPVALGAKVEDRLKVARNAKLVAAVGGMTTKTRAGRENATAGNAELKLRLGADERTQVRPLHEARRLHAAAE